MEILKITTATKSVRKTTIMKLPKAGVSNDNIVAIMGTKEKKASSAILILIVTYKNKEISAEKFLELHLLKSSPNCHKLCLSTSSKEGINMRDCFKSLCPQFNF